MQRNTWSKEGFPPAPVGICHLGDKLIEIPHEFREIPVHVGSYNMVVIREHTDHVDQNAILRRGDGEAVEDDLVGEFRWLEQEMATDTATREQIGGPR